MSALLREREGILDQLGLAVVVQDLIGVDELCITLKEVYAGQDLLIEPIFDLIVSREI